MPSAGAGGPADERGLARLNDLPQERAVAELMECCGSRPWATRVAADRPFRSRDELAAAAERHWAALPRDEWLAAFRAHPPIGGGSAEAPTSARERRWSAGEQAGAASAGDELLARLADANRRYRERFGYGFLVYATGKSAEEMLALLERRLGNDPASEIAVAAEEERKITRLRLEKLLEDS